MKKYFSNYQLSYKPYWQESLFIVLVLFFLLYQGYDNTINFASTQKEHLKYTQKILSAKANIDSFVDNNYGTWYFNVKLYEINGVFLAKPMKVRLSWYDSWSRSVEKPKIGENWSLWLKLKAIRSYSNPKLFDYELWAYSNRIVLKGYIHQNYLSHKMTSENMNFIDQYRNYLAEIIQSSNLSIASKSLINALLIGNRSDLTDEQWSAFRQTGTAHLLAISGLHIGFAAIILGCLVSFLWRRSYYCCRLLPAPFVFVGVGVLSAFLYAIISGFQIPAQRAFIMIFVGFISMLSRRFIPNYIIFIVAFIAVLMIDIRSLLASGFWLSFLSVMIIWLVLNKKEEGSDELLRKFDKNTNYWQVIISFGKDIYQLIKKIFKLQIVITLCLIPALIFYFQQISWLSPMANLVITPIVNVFVIPLLLLLLLLSAIPILFNWGLMPLGYVLDFVNRLLLLSHDIPFSKIILPASSLLVAVLTTILLLYACLTKDHKKRIVALIFSILFYMPVDRDIKTGTALVDILDVGQGLSIVIRTKNHSLLYDTGNRGIGERVIAPYFKNIYRKPNTIIISHGDVDHYGGFEFLENYFHSFNYIDDKNCQGEWQWDGVKFKLFQYKPKTQKTIKDNNKSCLLKISIQNGQSFLITADIEEKAEKWLIQNYGNQLNANILLIPHQGSKTSSSMEFIKKINPELAIYSAGYNNHFNHPSQKILARYEKIKIPVLGTICSGMISLTLDNTNAQNTKNFREKFKVHRYRKNNHKFWQLSC